MSSLLSLSWAGFPQNQALKLGSSIGGSEPREDEKRRTKVIQEEKGASYHHSGFPRSPLSAGKGSSGRVG